jgi:hypothetical protein
LKAFEALKEDAGFPHLLKAVGDKLISLDASYKRRLYGDYVSQEEQQVVAEDIAHFL